MLTNKAIDEIRKTRHEISEKYHHNTKELIDHYQELEKKYSDRIYNNSKKKKTCSLNFIKNHTMNAKWIHYECMEILIWLL